MKKGLLITGIVLSAVITVLVAIFAISPVFFRTLGSETPQEAFERGVKRFIDESLEDPVRECVPNREIAVLPMDDYMVMYIGYVQDEEIESNLRVVFCPMKILFGKYYPLTEDIAYGPISRFESQSESGYKTSLYSLGYSILPADSPEIDNFDSEIYSFVNAKYTDSKGVEQDVVFCYTYEINWEIGDGSEADMQMSFNF